MKNVFEQKALLGSALAAILTGTLTWVFRSDSALLAGACIGSLVAIHQLCFILTRPTHGTISTTLGIGVLAGYSLGTVNSAISLRQYGTLGMYFGRDDADLAIAMAIALIASGILLLIGQFETPVVPAVPLLEQRHRRVLWLLLAVLIGAYWNGDIGYMGVTGSSGGEVSTLGAAAEWISAVLSPLALIAFLQMRGRPGRMAYLFLWATSFVLLVPQGRRILIYVLIANFFAAYLVDPSTLRGITRKLAIGLLALVAACGSAITFYSFRIAVSQMSDTGSSHQVTTIFTRAIDVLQHDDRLIRTLQTNLEERTFVLCYLSDLAAAGSTHSPLHGEAALWDFEIAIPSVFMPNKDEVRAVVQEENLVNPAFGLEARDMANSVLTAGIGDFGIPGAVVYPILLAILIRAYMLVLRKLNVPTLVQLLIYLSVLNTLLQTESMLSSYFVCLRNATLFGAATFLITLLPTIKTSRPTPAYCPPVPEGVSLDA
jgi:hypothetical protein